MLSAEERGEIEREMGHYPDRRALSIGALKVVQRHRGWVSDDGLRDVAEFLGLSPADLEGVATFYNLIFRHPVGRHVILVCDSVSCWIMGGDGLREALSARLGVGLGQTTGDARFTLLPIVCLGACDRAPTLMVDGDFHPDVDATRVDALLERYP